MYRALYRTWRPARFTDVIGQQAITTALINQIKHHKIGHAYLFTGTRGTGKTTCAKIFAKAINCENEQDGEPCGVCTACVGIETGSLLDVVEIDAASNNSVDDIRELREETAYRPSYCKYKVYIIDEVHMLSGAAFNALLKIMEEPPAHVVFILATTEVYKVPVTIVSRCQRYDFKPISADEMATRMLYIAGQEEMVLEPEAAQLIARLANGGFRDALSLLDTCFGVNNHIDVELVSQMAGVVQANYLFEISDAVNMQDIGRILQIEAQLNQQAIDTRRLTEELLHHYRNILLASIQTDGALLTSFSAEEIKLYVQAGQQTGEQLALLAIKRLALAINQMLKAPDPRIELELALFDLCNMFDNASATQRETTKKIVADDIPKSKKEEPEEPLIKSEEKYEQPPQQKEIGEVVPEPISSATSPPDIASIEKEIASAKDALGEFTFWAQVVEEMKQVDRMLYSYMKSAKAYVDGKRVLIDGGDMFLEFMRTDAQASTKIKTAILNATGDKYSIGPYIPETNDQQGEKMSAEKSLEKLEILGIPVEYRYNNN